MTRHQPQIQTTEEGAGMARRRSARLHPQIQASEQSAGVTCRRSPRLHPQTQEIRRSPRLHPQIEAGKDGAGVTRRIRRRRGGASPASLPYDDDMLREILIRLPPQPSSLPRASAVCKRWRGLVTEVKFIRRFRAHHQKPPLLGVFERNFQGILFTPVLDPPNRIPPQRFNLGCSSRDYDLLDCRHGLVLAKDRMRNEVFVYDPITREQRQVAVPLEFKRDYYYLTGAVVCPAGNQDHMRGGCHLSPFKVVLVSMHREDNQTLACVYCSETGKWDNLISTEAPCAINDFGTPATLVGNVLHWLFNGDRILEFDLDGQNLDVTMGPRFTNEFLHGKRWIIQAEDGSVGFAILAHPRFRLWQRNINCHGVATWAPWKTIQMHKIVGLPLQIRGEIRWLLGYDEDNGVIFLYANDSVYAVQLKSMHSKKLYKIYSINQIHPFTSFYTPGTAINGGSNGAEMRQDT